MLSIRSEYIRITVEPDITISHQKTN